jgi:hypothetical protein
VAVAVLHLLARDEGPRDGVAPGEVGMLKVKARVEYGHLDAVPRERRDVRADRLQAPRDARLVDRRRRGARRYRTASIDRLGRRCLYDNAMAESFVDTFKTELIADRVWRTRTQLELAIVQWVAWFNNDRLPESLSDTRRFEQQRKLPALVGRARWISRGLFLSSVPTPGGRRMRGRNAARRLAPPERPPARVPSRRPVR